MSIYPSPRTRNGTLNTTFNNTDYIQTNEGGSGLTIAQTDARYLQNSGVVVSSAQTTFNNTVNIESNLSVSGSVLVGSLNAKQSTDNIISAQFSATQTYSYNTGIVYFMVTDSTNVSSFSLTDIPIDSPFKSYIFTFILQPISINSAFYIKPANILIKGVSTALTGLANVVLPSSYTHLVQQIAIINRSSTNTPSYIVLTSVSAY
jgi:hypothetical protein